MHFKEKKDLRKFRLNKSKSYFNFSHYIYNIANHSPNSIPLIQNNRNIKNLDSTGNTKVFLTNSIKPLNKMKSLNNYFKSTRASKVILNNSIDNSGINFARNIINSEKNSQLKNANNSNSIIKNMKNPINNESTQKSKKMKKVIINAMINNNNTINTNMNTNNISNVNSYSNKLKKSPINIVHNVPKRDKMDSEKVNLLLLEKYNLSKTKLMEKLFGKKDMASFLE